MKLLHYPLHQYGRCGWSNALLSMECGIVLARLTGRVLALDGNISPPANLRPEGGISKRLEAGREPIRARVTDLYDMPVQWLEMAGSELGDDEEGRSANRDFFNHIGLAGIEKRLPAESLETSFKFCFERHPFEKVLSSYHYRHGPKSSVSLQEFLDNRDYLRVKRWGRNLYCREGKVAVDRIYLCEELPGVLEEISDRLGLPGPLELPRAKSQQRTDRRSFRERLTARQREQLAEDFAEELELFGYEP